MKYAYVSPDELEKQQNLLTPGEADFEVLKATEKQSKSGNDMIELNIKVFDKDGKQTNVFDYLLSSEKFAWKIHQFCDAINKPEWYAENAELTAEKLVGQAGKCKIVIEKNDEYGDRVKIKNYLVPKNPVGDVKSSAEFKDCDLDDIPF